ncbi:hypothetical protein CES86_0380 [Brucella lupini]|uniref:Uncharacterized protein n=1 Tax=Brucella lupini TaxID=255457 RepID=A0A256GXT5_9HYPH|nr:hypothetical protein CES86_0380 [Brucella lupini]
MTALKTLSALDQRYFVAFSIRCDCGGNVTAIAFVCFRFAVF